MFLGLICESFGDSLSAPLDSPMDVEYLGSYFQVEALSAVPIAKFGVS